MIETTTVCRECGDYIRLEDTAGRWSAGCDGCFDNLPNSPFGRGETPEDALQDWSEQTAGLSSPRLSPLATFIVPTSPEGWTLTERFGFLIYGPAEGQKAANQ
jgi:hypothetical protein